MARTSEARDTRGVKYLSVSAMVACLALIGVGSAAARVSTASFTSRVHPGDDASLTVHVSPSARCTIVVVYDTVVSRARGLGAKTGSTVTWHWRVGSSTHAGTWPVVVSCGNSGTLRLRLRVLPG